jgi:hypothetical protein
MKKIFTIKFEISEGRSGKGAKDYPSPRYSGTYAL